MSTTERLRADIDSGRTGDKVRNSDPAAAPLGTDEEAAGTPVAREAVELARAHEVDREPDKERKGSALFYMTALAAIMIVLTCALLYVAGVR
jgi:hypothetical protein